MNRRDRRKHWMWQILGSSCHAFPRRQLTPGATARSRRLVRQRRMQAIRRGAQHYRIVIEGEALGGVAYITDDETTEHG